MKRIHYNILIICFALFSCMTIKAQNASSVKSAKTAELNALLKTKKWTISDIARFIPYDISMVDASFNTWLKSKEIVFYKEVNGQKKLVLPEEVDNDLKADYKDKLGVETPANYFSEWKNFFAKRCYAHGTAEYVLAKYQNKEITLKECIDKLKNAEDQKSYVSYMKSFVFYAMQQEPTAWDDLNGALKDVIAKNKKTGTCLAFMLCRTNSNPKQWVAIIKQVPKPSKFYNGSGDDSFREDATIMTTALDKIEPINYKDEYGGCLSGINLYLDGRVIMRRTNANIPIATLHSVQEETDCLSAYKGQEYTFLYNPNGENLYGFLQEKGGCYLKLKPVKPTLWSANTKRLSSEQFELVAGYKLNSAGDVIGESYIGMSKQQLAEELKKPLMGYEDIVSLGAQASEYKRQEEINKADNEYMYKEVTQLRKKYGDKPVDAMIKIEPYVGMPEGILNDYIGTIKGIKVKLFERVYHPVWNKYQLCGLLRSLGNNITVWCLNGVVEHVYHDGRL